ncbi:hypothetical protein MRX96_027144 [Rhipicephalus microplus]
MQWVRQPPLFPFPGRAKRNRRSAGRKNDQLPSGQRSREECAPSRDKKQRPGRKRSERTVHSGQDDTSAVNTSSSDPMALPAGGSGGLAPLAVILILTQQGPRPTARPGREEWPQRGVRRRDVVQSSGAARTERTSRSAHATKSGYSPDPSSGVSRGKGDSDESSGSDLSLSSWLLSVNSSLPVSSSGMVSMSLPCALEQRRRNCGFRGVSRFTAAAFDCGPLLFWRWRAEHAGCHAQSRSTDVRVRGYPGDDLP